MSQRRMFDKDLISSDIFISMPISTQALYFHLCMNADDEGFIDRPKTITKMIGASEDDLKILLAKRYVLPFESGVVVIKHWCIHNHIRKDRFKPTNYKEERSLLIQKENGSYTECQPTGNQVATNWQPSGNQKSTYGCVGKVSIGKYSIDKVSNNNIHTFKPPTLEEVEEYCRERNNNVNANQFIDFYESKGWMIGKNKMKDWKASIRTWEKSNKEKSKPQENAQQKNQKKLNAIGEALGRLGEEYEQHRDTKNIGKN